MSEFKGTKGNWEACFNWSQRNIEIGTPENEKIALVNKEYPEAVANAKLISCAPEMLEALKNLIQACYEDDVKMSYLEKAEELIKKATT